MSERDVVVVGAGPSGIATALALKDRGVRPLLVDRAEQVASAWRGRYDRLRLNTWRPFSDLPGRRFPRGTPTFPSRDQLIEHLDRHAHEEGIELKLGTHIERVDSEDHVWRLATSAGDLTARQVVIATGYEQVPFIPGWEGRSEFAGDLRHAAEYRNPAPYVGKSVLVVGPGCSGMEIAYDLVDGGAAKVWLSARTPPNLILRQGPGPIPGDLMGVILLRAPVRFADAVARFGRRLDLGDLSEYGLPVPEEGLFARLRRLGVAPAVIDREVIDAIKEGRIEVVRGVESLDRDGVQLADGTRIDPDAVICATGYRRELEPLVGHLDVLDERGIPRAVGAMPAARGLRFIGYVPRPGGLGYMGKEATRAARAIASELRASRPLPATPAAA